MKYYEDLYWGRFDYLGSDTNLAYNFGRDVFDLKQNEIDELKSKVQELWTCLDDRQSKETIIEQCEDIIKQILK